MTQQSEAGGGAGRSVPRGIERSEAGGGDAAGFAGGAGERVSSGVEGRAAGGGRARESGQGGSRGGGWAGVVRGAGAPGRVAPAPPGGPSEGRQGVGTP